MDFSGLKKDISLFLRSEEAKVLKKNVAKLGLTASALAMIMVQQIKDAQAQTSHTDVHTDSEGHADSHSDGHSDSHSDGPTHGDSHSSHTSHTSHTDGTPHTDHDDAAHGDGNTTHTDTAPIGGHWDHRSEALPYDTIHRKGGHFSNDEWNITHTDHTSG